MTQPSENKQKGSNSLKFVLPENVEDEAKIERIDFYKNSKPKLILFYLISLLTLGFVALLAKWKFSVRIFLKYTIAAPTDAKFLLIYGFDLTVEHINVVKQELCLEKVNRKYKTFKYRFYTFYLDESEGVYKPVQHIIRDKTYADIHKEMGGGLSNDAYNRKFMNYGFNSTTVPAKSNFEILIDEVLTPFYIFQLFAVIFWGFFNNYVIYASFIFSVSAITIIMDFFKVRASHKELSKKAHYEIEVNVYRTSSPEVNRSQLLANCQTINSKYLVPGDLVEIEGNKKMSCDIILLHGNCVINESMLTGESVPVIKQQLPKSLKAFDRASAEQHILFSGTECLEVRKVDANTPVLGVVISTGFATAKGRLVRSFLYSQPEDLKFYKDTLKFLGIVFAIALICFAVSCKIYVDQGKSFGYIFKTLLDIITIAVPPDLPTCLVIGSVIATTRLRKKKIITKTESKVNVAGRVQFMCFDKTGTLTEDSLGLYGVKCVTRNQSQNLTFQSLAKKDIHNAFNTSKEKLLSHKMLELMVTCHSLTHVKGVLVGDPLDMKMFEATEWCLKGKDESSSSFSGLFMVNPPHNMTEDSLYYNPNSQLIVTKLFEFSSKLQRMSVLMKDPQEEGSRLYVKGSPEVITKLCKPETIPKDLDKILAKYTQGGLRVIACATRLLEIEVSVENDLERDFLEKDLEFLGFIAFENQKRKVTPVVIRNLKDADINILMLTGDNPFTAIFVAKDCGIIDKDQPVILGTLVPSGLDSQSKQIEWISIGSLNGDENTEEEVSICKDLVPESDVVIEVKQIEIEQKPESQGPVASKDLLEILQSDSSVVIAMTGDACKYMDSSCDFDPLLKLTILTKAKVFARMRPDDKAFIIDKLQKQGYIVGMCGDGANDCPALKASNVGVSLSTAEASLAAPFLSKVNDISCVDILLREGRTALVTSFQCFKYMTLYSLIQAFSVVILQTRGSKFTDPSFLYQDLLLIIPTAVTMSLTLPTDKLSKKKPLGSLISAPVIVSMLGICAIQAVSQLVALAVLEKQDWYKDPKQFKEEARLETGEEDPSFTDYDSTVLFLLVNIQYFATVMVLSVGKPFRKPFYTNWLFTLTMLVTTGFNIVLILVPIKPVIKYMKHRDFDEHQDFRWIILIMVIVNTLIVIIYERVLVPLISERIVKLLKWKRVKTE